MLFSPRFRSFFGAKLFLAGLVSTLFFSAIQSPVRAEEVKIKGADLYLNAELALGDGAARGDATVLMVHGTLAHNAMETMAGLASVLNERGLNTLSINLSLGIDDRKGMYDCAVPHRHRHFDALNEIGSWLEWLQAQGVHDVTLFGHSRGGNQAALYAAERGHALVKNVALLAPATWDADKAAREYEVRHGAPLASMLERAVAQVAAGNGAEFLAGAGLLYCPGSEVTADSFVSYYTPDPRFDTPGILDRIPLPVVVIAGSEDTVVDDLPAKIGTGSEQKQVEFVIVDGADHFFLDLFAEDVADSIEEIIEISK